MDFSVMSYSFHRTFERGEMDIFAYIAWCKEHGLTQLEPWNRHLIDGREPYTLSLDDAGYRAFLDRVKQAAAEAGLSIGCIAVDGAHIYEPSAEARAANRAHAYLWLDIAEYLGARQIRVDAGGPESMPDEAFALIVEGYNDIIARGRGQGIGILTENHWGPTKHPENVVKLLEAIPGLGLLFDTYNWAPEKREKAWEMCARYAKATHIKTFTFDAAGKEPTANLSKAIGLLLQSGYAGTWGIESSPVEVDERTGAALTLALIKRELMAAGRLAA
jgi:hypothetical protein